MKSPLGQSFPRLRLSTLDSVITISDFPKLDKNLEFPNLQVVGIGITAHDVNKSDVDFMIGVLERAPKLEGVSLRYNFSMRGAKESILMVLEKVPWSNIRHLQLNGAVEDTLVNRIMELGPDLQLTQLSFSDQVVEVGSSLGNTFKTFLENQRNSLESLEFHLYQVGLETDFRLPQCPKLQKLEVQVRLQNALPALLDVPSFSGQFPSLRCLLMYCTLDFHNMDRLVRSKDKTPLVTVKELKLGTGRFFDWNTNLNETDARRLIGHVAQMFPCVKKLTLPSHPLLLRAIDTENAWNELEELVLLNGKTWTSDLALTGYSKEECTRISKWTPKHELPEVEFKVKKQIPKFLHRVKGLKFEHKGYWGDGFSDVLCRLVLLKLENLKCLDLRQQKGLKISKKVIREMSARFKVLCKRSRKRTVRFL